MKKQQLQPIYDTRKSFYGKATYTEDNDGHTLYSYDTPILKIYNNGTKEALWDGWSATTGRHINEFAKQFTGEPLLKKDYTKLLEN